MIFFKKRTDIWYKNTPVYFSDTYNAYILVLSLNTK